MDNLQNLKSKYSKIDSERLKSFTLRIHRSLSWLERASHELNDPDAGFIFYWIAFNCVYAEDMSKVQYTEREKFGDYFSKLVEKDTDSVMYEIIWNRFSQEIRLILDNKYVFAPFWKFQNGEPGYNNWESRYAASRKNVRYALANKNTVIILGHLFDRMYVLRNQLLHGGATWNSSVNRDQVINGHTIMTLLVPVFVELMIDNPLVDWGQPTFPVIDS